MIDKKNNSLESHLDSMFSLAKNLIRTNQIVEINRLAIDKANQASSMYSGGFEEESSYTAEDPEDKSYCC
jgi:hypothetical protein